MRAQEIAQKFFADVRPMFAQWQAERGLPQGPSTAAYRYHS